MKTRPDTSIVLNCLTLSSFFLSSPRLCRTQRVVENVHSITFEIETADHDSPLTRYSDLSPVDLPEGQTDVLPLIACFTTHSLYDPATVSLLSSVAYPTWNMQVEPFGKLHEATDEEEEAHRQVLYAFANRIERRKQACA